jgi:hypothetical protein
MSKEESSEYTPGAYALADRYARETKSIHFHETPNQEAKFAMELIARFGTIEGRPDGEDSAGRQKIRSAEAEEVVQRSFALAEAAFREMRRRGWAIQVPLPLVEATETVTFSGESEATG